MTYKSKTDWWFYATAGIMTVLGLLSIVLSFIQGMWINLFLGIWILILGPGFLYGAWRSTRYTLGDSALLIHRMAKPIEIPYTHIQRVRPVRSYLASNALSADRLEIVFMNGKAKEIYYISPENREEFMSLLDEKRSKTK